MFHRYAKSALICAVPPYALFASGCSALAAGNYSQSKLDCANDHDNHADSPLTQFNRGAGSRASRWAGMARLTGALIQAHTLRVPAPQCRNAAIINALI